MNIEAGADDLDKAAELLPQLAVLFPEASVWLLSAAALSKGTAAIMHATGKSAREILAMAEPEHALHFKWRDGDSTAAETPSSKAATKGPTK